MCVSVWCTFFSFFHLTQCRLRQSVSHFFLKRWPPESSTVDRSWEGTSRCSPSTSPRQWSNWIKSWLRPSSLSCHQKLFHRDHNNNKHPKSNLISASGPPWERWGGSVSGPKRMCLWKSCKLPLSTLAALLFSPSPFSPNLFFFPLLLFSFLHPLNSPFFSSSSSSSASHIAAAAAKPRSNKDL